MKSPDGKGEDGPLFLKGQTFQADLNTNIMILEGGVRGRKRMSDRRNMKLSSRRAFFSGQSNMVRFEKKVVMKVKDMVVAGPLAEFLYRNGQLDRLSMTGGIRIKDLDKWGVAGRADVYFNEDKYVFRGDPRIVQGEDELIGRTITILEGGDRVQVERARSKYQPKDQEEESAP